jgi:hypothetical protein
LRQLRAQLIALCGHGLRLVPGIHRVLRGSAHRLFFLVTRRQAHRHR